MPDRYAVIGNPIAQSKSPLIHAAFAHTTGQDMDYGRMLAPEGGFAEAVDAFRAQGGRGLNITAPFKLDAFAYATDVAPAAQWSGAVNALKFEGQRVLAENFDGIGLVRDLQRNQGMDLHGKRILLLGAGGAARGALFPLLQAQPALLCVANRTADKAQQLLAMAMTHLGLAAPVKAVSLDGLADQSFDLVLNATSSSLHAQSLPLPSKVFAPSSMAYDLTYGKGLTPFLHLAREAGALHLVDGVGMLVEQAAEAFAWWRGVRPETRAVIAQMQVPLV
jgi:shikimate dehydrogenase